MSKPSRALIVRSFQKDTIYIHKLQNALSKCFEPFIGNCNQLKYVTMLESIAKLVYYMSSSARALQTLGEEYTSLVAVKLSTGGKLNVPTRSLLTVYSLSQSISAVLSKLFVRLLLSWFRFYRHASTERMQLLRITLQSLLTLAAALNTGLFYLTGDGYRLAQRLLGISYLTMSSKSTDHFSTTLFQVIGAFNVARSVYDIWVTLSHFVSSSSVAPSQAEVTDMLRNDSPALARSRCSLCLESPCIDATAAICGHVFCWHCIVDSTRAVPECPLCRIRCHPSRLIYLQNL